VRARLATWASLSWGANSGRTRFLANRGRQDEDRRRYHGRQGPRPADHSHQPRGKCAAHRNQHRQIAIGQPRHQQHRSEARKQHEGEREGIERHHDSVAAQSIGALRRESGSERMRPHVEADGGQDHGGDVPGVTQVRRGPRHRQMLGAGLRQGCEHRADAAEVHVRDADADAHRRQQHERVLDHADPGDGANPPGKHESHQQHHTDRHGRSASDAFEARHREDDADAGDLELHIGDQANDGHQTGKRRQVAIAVHDAEEIRQRLHAVPAAQLPHLWQEEERDDVRQRQVGQHVESRPSPGIGPTAGPQKGERRVDLPGHQHKHQDRAEAAATHRPLFQVHPAPRACEESDCHTHGDDCSDGRQADRSRAHELRAASTR
jgi:hypothetical protein